jgi:flagellar biosynthesis/type III secretory pathway protein FliH
MAYAPTAGRSRSAIATFLATECAPARFWFGTVVRQALGNRREPVRCHDPLQGVDAFFPSEPPVTFLPLRQYHVPHAALAVLGRGAVLDADVLQSVRISDQIVRAARASSARIIQEAAEERAAQRERQLNEARAQAASEIAPLANQLRMMLARLQASAEHIAVNAATQALHKLLLQVPDAWPALSSARLLAAELARAQAADSSTLTLRARAEERPQLEELLQTNQNIRFCADDTLQPGECVLSGPQGELRADYHASVQALAQALHAPLAVRDESQETPPYPQESNHERHAP